MTTFTWTIFDYNNDHKPEVIDTRARALYWAKELHNLKQNSGFWKRIQLTRNINKLNNYLVGAEA
jgi:hypothetical protein